MAKINKRIEIVSSRSMALSSMGEESRRAAYNLLARHYAHVGITLIDDAAGLEPLAARKPDLVFLGMKYVPQNRRLGRNDPHKIWLSDYLEEHGVAHTGSGGRAHELEQNKVLAKRKVAQAGLKTSPFFVARRHCALVPRDVALRYPVFIKPANLGGGLGVDGASVAKSFAELAPKVRSIHQRFRADALVEEYLPGSEFSVAVMKNPGGTGGYMAMPIELTAPASGGASMLSHAVKTANSETVSAVSEPECWARVTGFALDAFRALGAKDYGRIDMRLDARGLPNFLEANLVPSLIDNYGSFPKACRLNRDMSYETMILNIVQLGLADAGEDVETAEAVEPADLPVSAFFGIQPA